LLKRFKKIAIDDGVGGKLRVDSLSTVCDKLGLHLLMLSEDMKYHFKYLDVINGSANSFLDDGEGCIDFEKFKVWWNMDAD